jgi:hypothetical protein
MLPLTKCCHFRRPAVHHLLTALTAHMPERVACQQTERSTTASKQQQGVRLRVLLSAAAAAAAARWLPCTGQATHCWSGAHYQTQTLLQAQQGECMHPPATCWMLTLTQLTPPGANCLQRRMKHMLLLIHSSPRLSCTQATTGPTHPSSLEPAAGQRVSRTPLSPQLSGMPAASLT